MESIAFLIQISAYSIDMNIRRLESMGTDRKLWLKKMEKSISGMGFWIDRSISMNVGNSSASYLL